MDLVKVIQTVRQHISARPDDAWAAKTGDQNCCYSHSVNGGCAIGCLVPSGTATKMDNLNGTSFSFFPHSIDALNRKNIKSGILWDTEIRPALESRFGAFGDSEVMNKELYTLLQIQLCHDRSNSKEECLTKLLALERELTAVPI